LPTHPDKVKGSIIKSANAIVACRIEALFIGFNLHFENVSLRLGVVGRHPAFINEALCNSLRDLELAKLLTGHSVRCRLFRRCLTKPILLLDHARDLYRVDHHAARQPTTRCARQDGRQRPGNQDGAHYAAALVSNVPRSMATVASSN
jgi:hypothetical protein